MTEEQINELLTDIISMYAFEFGRNITKKAASKLAASRVEEQIRNAGGHTYALAKTVFSECETILEENSRDDIISGVILSGAANMNPAFLLLWILSFSDAARRNQRRLFSGSVATFPMLAASVLPIIGFSISYKDLSNILNTAPPSY